MFDSIRCAVVGARGRSVAPRLDVAARGLALGAPLGLLSPDAAQAKKKHKKKRKKKKRPVCQPESKAQTCDGKCGRVANNCGTDVECGDCSCGAGCPVCRTCDPDTVQCVPDAQQLDDDCGDCHACDNGGMCAAVDDGTACDDGNFRTETSTCQSGVCTAIKAVSNGKECGTQPDGGTLRCCNGHCPEPTCIPNSQPCADEATCEADCCSGGSVCISGCSCGGSLPGEPCGSDNDCPFVGVQCQCRKCCVAPGENTAGECVPALCCSGACRDQSTRV